MPSQGQWVAREAPHESINREGECCRIQGTRHWSVDAVERGGQCCRVEGGSARPSKPAMIVQGACMCVGQLEVQVLQVPNCAVAHTRLFAAGRSRTTSVCEFHIDSQALPKPKCHSGSAAVGTWFRTPGKATYSNPVAWRLYPLRTPVSHPT